MCNNAGDLLGGEDTAPAAAAGSAGSMFAGLDVGTSTHSSSQPPSHSGTPSSLNAPQSPVDALAGLQGPSPSHPGIVWHLAVMLVAQSLYSKLPRCSKVIPWSLHHGQQDRRLTAQLCFVGSVHACIRHFAVHVPALLCCLSLCSRQFLVCQATHSCCSFCIAEDLKFCCAGCLQKQCTQAPGQLVSSNTVMMCAASTATGSHQLLLLLSSSKSATAGSDKPNTSTGLVKFDSCNAVTKTARSGTAGRAAVGGQAADMFGGLSMEAPSVSPSLTGMDGLLGLASNPQGMSPAAPASADLFGGLSVGGKRRCLPPAFDACALQAVSMAQMPLHQVSCCVFGTSAWSRCMETQQLTKFAGTLLIPTAYSSGASMAGAILTSVEDRWLTLPWCICIVKMYGSRISHLVCWQRA